MQAPGLTLSIKLTAIQDGKSRNWNSLEEIWVNTVSKSEGYAISHTQLINKELH